MLLQHPELEAIRIVGHSSGGQTVQRYALTHRIDLPKPRQDKSSERLGQHHVHVRFVVSNPSSYAYLDDRRFNSEDELETPSKAQIDACPLYNTWEWGLDTTPDASVPMYIKQVG